MNSKFKYAAGLPGYGLNGNDGSTGLSGFSLFPSDMEIVQDVVNTDIANKLTNNQSLMFASNDYIMGYPARKYQTGDLLIDNKSNVYVIDFNETGRNYQPDPIMRLGAEDFLTASVGTSIGNISYTRYANIPPDSKGIRKLIDNVLGGNTNYYSTSDIYGVLPKNFAQINSVNLPTGYGYDYHPYLLFNAPQKSQENAIAIVRDISAEGLWRFGNLDKASGYPRNTSITFDFARMMKNVNNKTYDMLTKYEMDASMLFSTSFDTAVDGFTFSQDGSTVSVSWNNKKILAVSNDDAVNANLVVFPIKTYNGQTFTHDVQSGSLYDVTNKDLSNSQHIIKINSTGSMLLTGLDPNVQYGAYIEYSMNGWVRRTKNIYNGNVNVESAASFKYIKITPTTDVNTIPSIGYNITAAVSYSSNLSGWKVLDVDKPSWVTVTPSSYNLGNTNVSILVSPQADKAPARSGTITFTSMDGTVKRSININQLTSINDNTYDSGWITMTEGNAVDKGDGPHLFKIRRYGNVVSINGIANMSNDINPGMIIASVPYDAIGGGLDGGPSVTVYFGGTDARPGDNGRSIGGYIPAYTGQANLQMITYWDHTPGYSNGTLHFNLTYICGS